MALAATTPGSTLLLAGAAGLLCTLLAVGLASAARQSDGKGNGKPPADGRWVVSWVGSSHGPYPTGNALAQPDLSLVFPAPASGARDQSFRLIVAPQLWGCQARLRFSNAFGGKPVTFADVFLGLQEAGAAVVAGSNRPVTFGTKRSATVAPGQVMWSDPVSLPFACAAGPGAMAGPELAREPGHYNNRHLAGRKLAVSFHLPGESGPMTWHAKALQTSYLTPPGGGSRSALDGPTGEAAFPFSTTSWFFLDAVDMLAPAAASAVVAFGDSITDGTNSTINGDDRWPDVLGRRLRAAYGDRFAVVNAGIGGNQVRGPAQYDVNRPLPGGPSALARLERDVLSLSGVSTVIWFEGINDFGKQHDASVDDVQKGLAQGVARMRAALPGVRVLGGTVTTALGASGNHGHPAEDAKRKTLNAFIRDSGLFDGVVDFDRAVLDPATGQLKPEHTHNTSVGGKGDGVHPNRLGYLAMALAVDLELFRPAAGAPARKTTRAARARAARPGAR
jgi:lysophospholipase L1-like esterase